MQIIINFLNAPIWSPLATIIGIIALTIAFLAYVGQRVSKSLTFTITSNSLIMPTIDLGKPTSDKFQILFDGKVIDNARLVIVRIWNSGNRPIKYDDYAKGSQLTLNFGEKAEILHSEIIETMPNSIKSIVDTQLKFDKFTISLGSPLLNMRDSITLKILIINFEDQITMDTQIAGKIHFVKKFSDKTLSPLSGRGLYNLALSSATFGIILFFAPTVLALLVLIIIILYLILRRILH